MTRLRVDPARLDAGYAALRLHQAWREGWFAARCNNHVSQASISRDVLKSFEMELPPLDVQRQIALLGAAADQKADSASRHLRSALEATERLRQSILTAACSGRLTADWRDKHPQSGAQELVEQAVRIRRERLGRKFRDDLPNIDELGLDLPPSWAWASPGALCNPDRVITYGVIKLGPPTPEGVPTLRSSDVRWMRIDTANVKKICREIADSYKRTYLSGGEVIVTVRGTLGGVAVVPDSLAGWNVSREVAVLPLLSAIDPYYCTLFIGSMYGQRWLGGVARGVAYTGVNIEDIRRLPLPLPPLDEQREIVKRVTDLFKSAGQLLSAIRESGNRVDRTSQAILAKALRGEFATNG